MPAAERSLPAGLVDRLTALVEEQLDVDRLLALGARRPTDAAAVRPLPERGGPDARADRRGPGRGVQLLLPGQPRPAERPGAPSWCRSARCATRRCRTMSAASTSAAAFRSCSPSTWRSTRRCWPRSGPPRGAGCPIYAECGGLMYLQESLVDADGRRHRMAGLVPGESTLVGKRLTLGYREVRARRDTPIARAGQQLRGHEFHWSVCDAAARTARRLRRPRRSAARRRVRARETCWRRTSTSTSPATRRSRRASSRRAPRESPHPNPLPEGSGEPRRSSQSGRGVGCDSSAAICTVDRPRLPPQRRG